MRSGRLARLGVRLYATKMLTRQLNEECQAQEENTPMSLSPPLRRGRGGQQQRPLLGRIHQFAQRPALLAPTPTQARMVMIRLI